MPLVTTDWWKFSMEKLRKSRDSTTADCLGTAVAPAVGRPKNANTKSWSDVSHSVTSDSTWHGQFVRIRSMQDWDLSVVRVGTCTVWRKHNGAINAVICLFSLSVSLIMFSLKSPRRMMWLDSHPSRAASKFCQKHAGADGGRYVQKQAWELDSY